MCLDHHRRTAGQQCQPVLGVRIRWWTKQQIPHFVLPAHPASHRGEDGSSHKLDEIGLVQVMLIHCQIPIERHGIAV